MFSFGLIWFVLFCLILLPRSSLFLPPSFFFPLPNSFHLLFLPTHRNYIHQNKNKNKNKTKEKSQNQFNHKNISHDQIPASHTNVGSHLPIHLCLVQLQDLWLVLTCHSVFLLCVQEYHPQSYLHRGQGRGQGRGHF